ncbi:DVL family [Arabidopsis thaliana x Arabidopsis arenosa]|uniref:DVL family n=2 Tax=Arabidopsis TaxID=3701 RepID=A0A8T2HDG1_ARASU|nr:ROTUNDIFOLIA like 9 [Arabidopsis thaliana]AEE32986.1 ROTUNDIFOLIA like 9 [Arabidopsis thaliana]KAG7649532.1 DVL family [Arabidopsis thaliana x Arabidopsis arenosa]KAG7657406.1 DVL family [Arabidopsis suecica]|eukprot:NP_001077714.2 ROTUNDIFOLIA like 9 [Arabidopsis thaliana]
MAEFKSKLNKGHAFTSKCASLVKEQRARLYILRRCATMLCCWYIQGDDSPLAAWQNPFTRNLTLSSDIFWCKTLLQAYKTERERTRDLSAKRAGVFTVSETETVEMLIL